MRTVYGRALFRMFWNSYDALGTWVLLNLAAVGLSMTVVGAPAAWGALLHCATRADADYAPAWKDFRTGLARYGWRSTVLGGLAVLILLLSGVNALFYVRQPFGLPPLAAYAVAGLFGWLGWFGWLAVQTAWAFLVLQDLPLRKALGRGLRVTLAHPLSSALTGFTALIFFGLMLFSGLGAAVFGLAAPANLWLGLAAGAVEYYEELDDVQTLQRMAAEGHRTWTEKREVEERSAARVRRYQRGLREILRPWEMK